MANEFMDDHEQGEAVKKFIKQHGSSLIVGVALGLGGLFGFQQYQSYTMNQRADAALQYSVLQEARSQADGDFVIEAAQRIRQEYKSTPYAAFAAMAEAEQRLSQGELEAAESALRWAVDNAEPRELRTLAAIRLGRIMLEAQRAQQALDLLAGLPAAGYQVQINELRGDVLMSLDRRDEARAAYEDALASMQMGAAHRNVVEMKFNDLQSAGDAG